MEQQIEIADRAIMEKDYDMLMSIYTDDAVLVVEPAEMHEEKIRSEMLL